MTIYKCHILRTHTLAGCTGKIDTYDLGALDIVCSGKKLLNQLRTTLTYSHGTQSTVTGV